MNPVTDKKKSQPLILVMLNPVLLFLSFFSCPFFLGHFKMSIRQSQKTRQSTVQEINGVQSWISPPPLMAAGHCKTSIVGAVIVSKRRFLEPH